MQCGQRRCTNDFPAGAMRDVRTNGWCAKPGADSSAQPRHPNSAGTTDHRIWGDRVDALAPARRLTCNYTTASRTFELQFHSTRRSSHYLLDCRPSSLLFSSHSRLPSHVCDSDFRLERRNNLITARTSSVGSCWPAICLPDATLAQYLEVLPAHFWQAAEKRGNNKYFSR